MSGYQPRVIETHGAEIVHTPRGGVAHVLRKSYRDGHGDVSVALCGRWSWSRSEWLGLGSYQEWEDGRRKPLCMPCLNVIIANDLYGWKDGVMPEPKEVSEWRSTH